MNPKLYFLCLFFASLSSAADFVDLQLWPQFTIYKNLSPTIKSRVSEELKWQHNMSTFYLDRFEVGFDMETTSWFTWGMAFKVVRRYGEEKSRFNVPYGDLIFKWKTGPVALDLRNRFEYWILKQQPSFVRVRQRLRMSLDQPLSMIRAKPYIAEEYFYDFGIGFKLNRVYVGSSILSGSLVQFQLYYCLQHLHAESVVWRHSIWGIGASLNLE